MGAVLMVLAGALQLLAIGASFSGGQNHNVSGDSGVGFSIGLSGSAITLAYIAGSLP